MKQNNIDAYLEGKLSGSALESFEAAMSNDPSLAKQVSYLSQLTDDIEMVSIDEEVRSILNDKSSDDGGPKNKGKWFGLLIGIAVMLFTINTFWKNENGNNTQPIAPIEQTEANPDETTESVENEPVEQPTPPTIKNNQPAIDQKKPAKKQPTNNNQQSTTQNRPIAQNTPSTNLPPPLHPSPKVRGQNGDDTAWKEMLDKIWYTEFPLPNADFKAPFKEATDPLKERDFKKAFIKLELAEMKMEANDTLHFLKGYCLLEMGEGGDAIRFFDKIENPPSEWQPNLEWYRALGVLISKGVTEAIPLFKELANDKNHPFHLQSEKALEGLE